jgi:hypothetical protein
MNDLFQGDPLYIALMERVEALEAIVYASQKVERTKADEPLNEAWQIWNRHRSGKGWTAKARELSMRKLRELAGADGALALKIVEQAVERGWTALYPIKSSGDSWQGAGKSTVAPSAVQSKTVKEALTPTETPEQAHRNWLKQQKALGFG